MRIDAATLQGHQKQVHYDDSVAIKVRVANSFYFTHLSGRLGDPENLKNNRVQKLSNLIMQL